MKNYSGEALFEHSHKMHYILRIAAAMCFIGHGAFGIITKPIWCNYFAVFGIGKDLAYTLMPIVGSVDIILGLILLFYPIRAIPAWLVAWGIVTASLRPLSGEPFAELIERAGNFGAPLALLILGSKAGQNFLSGLWSKLDPNPRPTKKTFDNVVLCLRIVVFLLLVGHGWLNLIGKKALLAQYTSLGFPNPEKIASLVAGFELGAAVIVLIKPVRYLLLIFFIWKMGTELFYPKWEIFEWVERAGSYGAILALYVALGKSTVQSRTNQHKLAV
ncbi:MAG: hypothetical protein JST68_08280 [Bacteroidetes bacterium]|nr:hypothetical protein [Bacteroidota bacterium]